MWNPICKWNEENLPNQIIYKNELGGCGCSLVAEHLPRMYKALGLISSTEGEKKSDREKSKVFLNWEVWVSYSTFTSTSSDSEEHGVLN
jgi:hypothetical protein